MGAKRENAIQQDSTWFVKFSYDIRPTMAKVLLHCEIGENNSTSFLPVEQALRAKGCHGLTTTYYRNGLHYLRVNDKSYPLAGGEFLKLFLGTKNDGRLKILPNKELLVGDFYFIEFNSKKYATLFMVTENGEVTLLTKNRKGTISFPNKKDYDGLEAFANGAKISRDLVVVLECDKQQQFGSFLSVTDEVQTSEKLYKFNTLIKFMNADGCNANSEFITIRD